MSPKINDTKTTSSLGELLKKRRSERGLDLETVAADTRISLKILQAMEDGEYPALPADAFSRGFYSLYAQKLELNTQEILKMYSLESKGHPNLSSNHKSLPGSGGGEVLEFAERPRSLHFSAIGFFLIVLLLFGAFLCWYFSWNPATFLSQKLRSYQQDSQQVENSIERPRKGPKKAPLFQIVKVIPRQTSSSENFSFNTMMSPAPPYFHRLDD